MVSILRNSKLPLASDLAMQNADNVYLHSSLSVTGASPFPPSGRSGAAPAGVVAAVQPGRPLRALQGTPAHGEQQIV